MILKKLKRTSFTKPKATMIGNLVDYILAAKDDNDREKTVYAAARNFFSRTPAGWKTEMTSLASESIQSKMPVTHWSLSWQENEQPSHEQIEDAVSLFLERMGLEGHQLIYALHGNTANLHLHIAVNRTNPDTLKVVQPHKGFDIEEAHRIVAVLERRQGWASESNPRYMVNDQGEVVRRQRQPVIKPRNEAANFESSSGEKSAQRIAQERGHAVIKNAQSWKELHEGLAKARLRFEKKGSGAVVFVGDTAVKASSVDRNFGLSKLCKRLGDYEPGNYEPEMKTPEPEPVSDIALEEWREYRRLQETRAIERDLEERRKAASVRRVTATQREHRVTALARLARHGLPMLNIARHFLKEQQREELRALRRDMPRREKPLPRFWKWLGQHNPRKASLWKFRRRIAPGMEVRQHEFPKVSDMLSPYMAYRALIGKKAPEPMDDSRRDAMTALWMRATGYSVYEVADEMFKKARPLRMEKEHRDWKSYARRVAQYAFSAPGDIDIAHAGLTPEKILNFHQEAEKLEALWLAEVKHLENVFTLPHRLVIAPAIGGNACQGYMVYHEAVLNKFPATKENTIERDALIALRLRVSGYGPEEIADAIGYNAPILDTATAKDWKRYAAKVTEQAFSPQGDRIILETAWLRDNLPSQDKQHPEESQRKRHGTGR